MAHTPSTTYLQLQDYIRRRMRMSHIYQPLMLMELLGRRSPAPAHDIARRILGEDVSQIECYTERVKRMVSRVLPGGFFPPEHTTYSKPIAGLSTWEAGDRDILEPNSEGDSHPYRVQFLLPRWTIENDWELRSWLFGWADGVRIESPARYGNSILLRPVASN